MIGDKITIEIININGQPGYLISDEHGWNKQALTHRKDVLENVCDFMNKPEPVFEYICDTCNKAFEYGDAMRKSPCCHAGYSEKETTLEADGVDTNTVTVPVTKPEDIQELVRLTDLVNSSDADENPEHIPAETVKITERKPKEDIKKGNTQFIFKEAKKFDWSKCPEKTHGKMHVRQKGNILYVSRDGYGNRIFVDVNDIYKLRGMDKYELKTALSGIASLKKTILKILIKEFDKFELVQPVESEPKKDSNTFKEAQPFDITGRPDKYGEVLMWDHNGSYAIGKKGQTERLFVSKEDTERLMEMPKTQLWIEASKLSLEKQQVLTEFIETLKDIKIGCFPIVGTDTSIMSDPGDGYPA